MVTTKTYAVVSLPLAASTKVYKGGMACLDISVHCVTKGAASNANLKNIGVFHADFDNSTGALGDVMAQVDLYREIVLGVWDNATGGNAVAAANLFTSVYILDDHTVTTASSGNSVAGRVWAVTADGVVVESLDLI